MKDNAPAEMARGADSAARAGQAHPHCSAPHDPHAPPIDPIDLHAAIVDAAGPGIDVATAFDKATDLVIAEPEMTVAEIVRRVLPAPPLMHADDLRRLDADADRLARQRPADERRIRVNNELPAELTDAGNAQRFVRDHGADVRYVTEWGYMEWDGTRWRRDDLAVRQRMLDAARDIHVEAASVADAESQKAIAAWARKSQHAQRIGGGLWCAQPALAARTDDFDNQPWLFPCASGTVDLRTGTLRAHRREDMLTRISGIEYAPDAVCPLWDAFLQRVMPDPDVRAFLARLAGYSLTGRTDEQVLAFLHGGGRNGKTVFIETVAALAGDFHQATRIETLTVSRSGIPNDVAALAGARLVTVSETPEGARLNEPLVKDLTGGDTISARFLNKEFFQFRPQFKIWIRGNHKPQIRGTDDGIWRRVLLIPFNVQIPEAEIDVALQDKLRAELPGILRWCVEGCLEWQRSGLKPPAAVIAATSEYRQTMDTLAEFFDEKCVVHTGALAKAADLYAEYRRWSEAAGHPAVSQTRFGTSLGERGFRREKYGAQNVVHWFGIGLSERNPGPPDGSDPFGSSGHSRARNSHEPARGSEPSGPSETCPRCDGGGCGYCGDTGVRR